MNLAPSDSTPEQASGRDRWRQRISRIAPEVDLATFDNGAGYDGLVLVRDIPVRSLCEHHLLPFVGVVIEAEHSCMGLRGARAWGARTLTSTLRGSLRDDPSSRAEFLALTRGGMR